MRTRALALLAIGLIVIGGAGGCSSAPQLEPGADRVMVVGSDAAVSGGTLVGSHTGTIGWARSGDLTTRAQNFGAMMDANVVLLRQTPSSNNLTNFTMEAWKVPPKH